MTNQAPSQRILFITSTNIGDAILSTGVLAHLIKEHPNAQVTVVCGAAPAGLFRTVPHLERLIILRQKSWKRHWLEFWASCIGTKWEVIADIRNSLFSRLLFTHRHVHRPPKHSGISSHHKVIENAAALGLASSPPAPHIWLDAEAETAATRLLACVGDAPILALGPAANWPPKQWPLNNFAELAKLLTAADGVMAGAYILIAAAAHEREQVAPLLAQLPPELILDAVGLDLLTVAACLKRCRLFVGNDSGLMHLAAAMGTTTLGLFGPGMEGVYGPWGTHCHVVRTPESREELISSLTHHNAPNLMETLTVDTVAKAATAFLLP